MNPIAVAIILYIAAVGLILLDLFVPSAGTLIILSLSAAVGSVIFGFRAGPTTGMAMLTLVAASIPILGVIAIRVWPKTPIGRRVVLGLPPVQPTETSVQQNSMSELIGYVVVSEYPMMPGGQITVDHRSYNAIAEAGYIDAGQTVVVVGCRDRNLIVRVSTKPVTPTLPRSRTSEQTVGPENFPKKDSSEKDLLNAPAAELGFDSLEE